MDLLRRALGFAWHNKIYWVAPLVLVLILLALVLLSGPPTSSPFIYQVK